MERRAINPSTFSVDLGFDQAHLVTDHRRELFCSAQDSVDDSGATLHAGDMRAQISQALDNLEALLADAEMSLDDVVRLNFFATDLSELFKHFTTVTERFNGHRFATTVVGVSALAGPDLMVALEATAVD